MEKKKTLLLTVIAVATLLVAVVGATFAYFAAQGGATVSRAINVTTSSTASSSFEINNVLSISATQETFSQTTKNNLTSSTTAKATFVASNATDAVLKFCYTVTLKIDTNTFVYSSSSTKHPELLFNITKGGTEIKTGVTNLSYATIAAGVTSTGTAVSGFDITTKTGTYQIGGTHEITAGGAGQTATENWTAGITLVNLNADQNYNTNKTFTGTLQFAKANCS